MEGLNNLGVLVTGGAGFIGSHLVEKLLGEGAQVTIIDNFLFGSKIDHLRGNSSLSIIEGDIRDTEAVSRALSGQDIVFHLAACVGVEETQQMPLEVLDVEIQGTLTVLKSAAKAGVKRFVFGSSSEVYGESEKPMQEESTLSPKSTYAVAKLVGEEYCRAFYKKHGMEYTCLRYFNVYGSRQDERFVIPRFASGILSRRPVLIYGDGKQTRDFTYIDDAVAGSLLAALTPAAKCQTINIGTGVMATINDIAGLLARTLDGSVPVKPSYVDYDAKRPRGIEVFSRVADISRARQLLRYEPETPLPSGMKKYASWRQAR